MLRGRNQVLFKFAPEAIIDYSDLGMIARVSRWRTQELPDVNKPLLVEQIEGRVRSFPAGARGYPRMGAIRSYVVLSPRQVDLDLFPLSFYCENPACDAAYRFSDLRDLERKTRGRYRCPRCGGAIRQFDFIHWHTCGRVESFVIRRCKVPHPEPWVVLDRAGSSNPRRWRFECKVCDPARPVVIAPVGAHCDQCGRGQRMRHGPFRTGDAFYPETVSLIDLGPIGDGEREIRASDFQAILANYLGLINDETKRALLDRPGAEPDADYQRHIQELRDRGIPQDVIDQVLGTFRIGDVHHEFEIARQEVERLLTLPPEESRYAAIDVHGYNSALHLDGLTSIEAVLATAEAQDDPNLEAIRRAPEKMHEMGIERAWVVRDLPVLLGVIGYSRGDPEKRLSILNAFHEDRDFAGRTPIYANRVQTEAIVLELGRKHVVRWLRRCGVSAAPDPISPDRELKAWLLNNVRLGLIQPFEEIIDTNRATKLVYTLVHSLSHTLLASASAIAGLDKNSMSEIIFPSVPAVIIYSNSAADFQLGGMFTLFESQPTTWLDLANDRARHCLYDPMCTRAKGACHACLFLAEISCEHLNHDLCRSALIGQPNGRYQTGYWDPT